MSTDKQIVFFVINMDKDTDRLLFFKEQMDKQGLSFDRHKGPLIDSKVITFAGNNYSVHAKGYVGVALAHLTAWKRVAQMDDDNLLCNIFEDDEVLRDNYKENVMAEVNKIKGPIDFFNLNVIRPQGSEVVPGILKIDGDISGKKIPNIWLSNYIITPIGARKILALISKEVTNLNINFDRTFVKLIHKHCKTINSYILKEQDKHSIHDEDESSKKEMNNKHIFFKAVSLIRKIFRKK